MILPLKKTVSVWSIPPDYAGTYAATHARTVAAGDWRKIAGNENDTSAFKSGNFRANHKSGNKSSHP
jgi:hypothetical protein